MAASGNRDAHDIAHKTHKGAEMLTPVPKQPDRERNSDKPHPMHKNTILDVLTVHGPAIES